MGFDKSVMEFHEIVIFYFFSDAYGKVNVIMNKWALLRLIWLLQQHSLEYTWILRGLHKWKTIFFMTGSNFLAVDRSILLDAAVDHFLFTVNLNQNPDSLNSLFLNTLCSGVRCIFIPKNDLSITKTPFKWRTLHCHLLLR